MAKKFKVEVSGTAYHSGEGYANVYDEQDRLVRSEDLGMNNGWNTAGVSAEYSYVEEAEKPEDIQFFWPF